MTKYNQLFKQKVIEFYLQHNKNQSLTRKHFRLKETTLRDWIAQFNYNGINGLASQSQKQPYSLDFKLTVIQTIKNGQFSIKNTALHFGIPHASIISQWLKAFEKQGINNGHNDHG